MLKYCKKFKEECKMALVTPRTLSGFKDRLPKEALAKALLLNQLSDVFMKFGFVPIETPHLEYADVLVKQGSDEIQKELYRFTDHGGRDVALRFDLTVPLARFISQYKNEVNLPFKRFAIGSVFRGERAQRGRYDNLTRTFSKERMSGVGASIGLDRLLAALEELGLLHMNATSACALIVCMDRSYFGYAHLLAETFRRSKVPIEVYPEINKLKKQFGYANTKGYEFVIVIGESEFSSKTLTLKNMASSMQMNNISFLKALTLIQEEKEDRTI